MLDGTYHFECHCGSDEHTLRFTLNKEDSEIYTSVFLNSWRSWWKRAWVGFRYIFGYKCMYGEWDNWTLHLEDAYRLREMLDDFMGGDGYKEWLESNDSQVGTL